MDLPVEYPAWQLIIDTTATAILANGAVLSPRKAILGGSVHKGGALSDPVVFDRLRHTITLNNSSYLPLPDDGFVPPSVGDDAGVHGAIAFGVDA